MPTKTQTIEPQVAEQDNAPKPDPEDPTRDGNIFHDITPFNTRSMADASAGVSTTDVARVDGTIDRQRDPGPPAGGAYVEVEDGTPGFTPPPIDDMTPDQCKGYLLNFGMDVPVGQARKELQKLIDRAANKGKK